MRLATLILAATLGDPAADVPLAPAPGAPPESTVTVGGETISLDASGRARVARDAAATASGLRFYRTAPDATGGEQAFYYPADAALATWPLPGIDGAAAAEIVVKDHDAETWEGARRFAAPLEAGEGRRSVRLALLPGAWDIAVLVPGWAPAFAMDVRADGEPLALKATRLERAARVKARVLDARTGKAPERWDAYLSRVGADPESNEARLFDGLSISGGRSELDFASLPVGSWELTIRVPDRSEPHQAVKVSKPGVVANLGDIYVTDFGKLRVVLVFPAEVPPGSFEVNLTRSRLEFGAPDIALGSGTVTARGAETALEFAGIEPGEVDIECGNPDQRIRRNASAIVEPGRAAEARLVIRPVKVHGTVRRGDDGLPGAAVSAPVGRKDWPAPEPVLSDELGGYELKTWGGTDTIFLTTLPPGDTNEFAEWVTVDPEALDVAHDVLLPGAEIRGVVRDAETGALVAGADVQFSTAIPEVPPADPENYMTFMLSYKTDEEGRFRLANLDSNKVDVEVSFEGYGTSRFPGVQPTPEGTELDVRLEKGRRLSGTIVDESGAPMPGVTVGLDADAGQFFSRTAVTSASGRYSFTDVGAGAHALGVFPCARTLVWRTFTMPASDEETGRGHTENVQLVPELSPILVTVENADGTPAGPNAYRWAVDGFPLPVHAWMEATKACGHSEATDDQGKLALHGFPLGTISALSFWSQSVYGTFANDGTQTAWTIRLPEERNAEVEQQAAR